MKLIPEDIYSKLHDLNLHLPLGLALQHSFRKSHNAKMNMLAELQMKTKWHVCSQTHGNHNNIIFVTSYNLQGRAYNKLIT